MTQTPNLAIDYLVPAQAQKHVTVNDAFIVLDMAAQCAVLEMSRNDPPAPPVEGHRYLVGDSPTGDWQRKPRTIACWINEGWRFTTPKPGWRLYNLATDRLHILDSHGVWVPLSATPGLDNIPSLGLGGPASTDNPFTAKLNAALWTARGSDEGGTGDLFLTSNRATGSNSVGHLFQTAYATRAMLGQFGTDQFALKLSPDGTDGSFKDALLADDATGIVDLPRLPRFKAYTDDDKYAPMENWTTVAVNMGEYNEQVVFDPASGRFTAPADGTYVFGASVLHKLNAIAPTSLRLRLLRNGSETIRGSLAEITGPLISLVSAANLHTLVQLSKGDTVEAQGFLVGADGYFAAEQTCFWGYKVG